MVNPTKLREFRSDKLAVKNDVDRAVTIIKARFTFLSVLKVVLDMLVLL